LLLIKFISNNIPGRQIAHYRRKRPQRTWFHKGTSYVSSIGDEHMGGSMYPENASVDLAIPVNGQEAGRYKILCGQQR
jgi:hypothetical protein